MKKKRWSDYLWIAELLYLFLGLFNILFAWLGMLFFTIPLLIAVFGGGKAYCKPLLRARSTFRVAGGQMEAFQKCTSAEVFCEAHGSDTDSLPFLWLCLGLCYIVHMLFLPARLLKKP